MYIVLPLDRNLETLYDGEAQLLQLLVRNMCFQN